MRGSATGGQRPLRLLPFLCVGRQRKVPVAPEPLVSPDLRKRDRLASLILHVLDDDLDRQAAQAGLRIVGDEQIDPLELVRQ